MKFITNRMALSVSQLLARFHSSFDFSFLLCEKKISPILPMSLFYQLRNFWKLSTTLVQVRCRVQLLISISIVNLLAQSVNC